MTGATVESVLQAGGIATFDDLPQDPLVGSNLYLGVGADASIAASGNVATQRETDEEVARRLAASPSPTLMRQETDEEMARRLAQEWEEESKVASDNGATGMSALSAAARAASPMDVDRVPQNTKSSSRHTDGAVLSDEDFARKLQAEYDEEAGGAAGASSSSVGAVDGSPLPLLDRTETPPTPLEPVDEYLDAKLEPATVAVPPKQHEFEQYGASFALYHYNGLRGGVLTNFRVTRLTAEEAVGTSTALHRTTEAGGGGKSGDLEDIVRTKWPSSMINWLGKPPPSVD